MKFEFSPHIAFQVKDYEDACQFYEEVLGFEKVEKKESETHYRSGSMNFYVEDSNHAHTYFEFKVNSVQEAKSLLEEKGCRVTQVFSEKSILIADPYGMRFHIWEEGADFGDGKK